MKKIVLLNLYLAVLENGGPRASPHHGPSVTPYQIFVPNIRLSHRDNNQIQQSAVALAVLEKGAPRA
jgi:hypothetical protein